jgi:hypothetical protein
MRQLAMQTPRSWLHCARGGIGRVAELVGRGGPNPVADLCARAWRAYASCGVTQRGLLFGE